MKYPLVIAALAIVLIGATAANAHATLDQANPAVGSTVKPAPRTLTLTFTQKLEPAFSTVEVRDSKGGRVDTGKAQVDRANPAVMHVGLKPLAKGTYRVRWQVLSVDTHRTQGDFTFNVGE
jgi:hypothetical protein